MVRTVAIIAGCLIFVWPACQSATAIPLFSSIGGSAASSAIMPLGIEDWPQVTLGLTGDPLAEAGGGATVTATLSAASGSTVTVALLFAGTAALTSDYLRSGTNIAIAAGQLSGSVALTAVQDERDETDETVTVSIGSATNATVGSPSQVTATIADDDLPPSVTLSVTGASMAEAGGTATVRATLSAASGLPVTVWLAFSGSATLTSDYTRSGTNILIAAGSTSGLITLKAVQDALDETNQTVTVSIGAVTNATLGATTQVTGTVIDDDPPPAVTLGFAEARSLVEGYGIVTLAVSLSAASELPVAVAFAFSGSAEFQDDYTWGATNVVIGAGRTGGTLTLCAVQDSAAEGLEAVVVDIDTVVNGTESGVQRVTIPLADDEQRWVGVGERVSGWTNSVPADRVRLGVRSEGVYRVTAGEFAAAAGVPTNAALEALAAQGLSLSCQGRAIAWATDGASLYFYGVPAGDLFAPENVYWLAFGSGVVMEAFDAAPGAGAATNAWFLHAESYRQAFLAPYDYRDRRSTGATLTNVLNFGEWFPASASQARQVALPEFCQGAATGCVARVSLVSYKNKNEFTASDNHACEVWLNGTSCGSRSWTGEQAVVFDYAAAPGVVTNGPAEIRVRNGLAISDVCDFMLLDPVLIYPCNYRARAGVLLCAGGDAPVVAADGFGSPRIRVWDVTEPELPLELEAPVCSNGTYQVTFACGDAFTRYAVFDESAGCFEPSVAGVRDTDWCAPSEMPELAIVIPPRRWIPGFDTAVRPLAEFRSAQGLRTRVIDAEELYNAFTDGLVNPLAFRRFSALGATGGPSQTLRYLLFAGHGGSDYKLEVFRLGESAAYPTLFPLYLLSQEEPSEYSALLLPNDPVLGDVAGGAAPEVAVGRFLATRADELADLVAKTIRYELTETWKNKAVFTADWQNEGQAYADFTGIASNTAAGFAEAGWTLEQFYPEPTQKDVGSLWELYPGGPGAHYELQEGSGFFYYVGHSTDTVVGYTRNDRLFDAPTLAQANWAFAPVALMMGCRMGRWTLLDLKEYQQCIAEAGARNRNSGFAAIISASGYTSAGDAEAFSFAFRNQVRSGALRLGDAWCGAFQALGSPFSERMQHLTLLGDPSLFLRAGQTARGTPSSWLISFGLTGTPYADLDDQDGDGFVTWQEGQAGTSPVQGGVRVRALSVPGAGTNGLPLTFEPVAGLTHRVVSTTNLAGGVWDALPLRTDAGSDWSWSGTPGDWPLKTVEVPYDAAEPQRFYKIEAF